MADIINDAPAKRGRGRPKKADGERKADLPEAVRYKQQIEREEAGQNWGCDNPEDMDKILESAETIWQLPDIDTHDEEQVKERLLWYLGHCRKLHIRPSHAGLGAVLGGVHRTTIWRWANGEGNTSEICNMIKKMHQLITYALESGALEGAIDRVITIFLLKNHSGYTDAQEFVVETKQTEFEERKMSDVLDEYDDTPEAE